MSIVSVEHQQGAPTRSLNEIFKDRFNSLYSLLYHHHYRQDSIMAVRGRTEEEEGPSSCPQNHRLHSKAEDCGSSLVAGTASLLLKKSQENVTEFSDLPIGVVLHIASYLDAKSLCHLQQTSKQLYTLTRDELLWRKKLVEDSKHWPVVGHLSHPQIYQDTSSDLTAQEIYGSCYVNRTTAVSHQNSFTFPVVTQKLRSFMRLLQGHVPRLLMFGSGLESIPLVKRMILDTNSPYKPTTLFPGKDGAGSGMGIKHNNTSINLVTLYTATKAERVAASTGHGKRINKLINITNPPLATDDDDDGNGDGNALPTLTNAVQEQCRLADGLILAIDACNLTQEEIDSDMMTLRAMVQCSSQRIPILVLSCTYQTSSAGTTEDSGCHDDNIAAIPSIDVADKLKLLDISNPWQVRNLNVKTFQGLDEGFDWILAIINNI